MTTSKWAFSLRLYWVSFADIKPEVELYLRRVSSGRWFRFCGGRLPRVRRRLGFQSGALRERAAREEERNQCGE